MLILIFKLVLSIFGRHLLFEYPKPAAITAAIAVAAKITAATASQHQDEYPHNVEDNYSGNF